MSSTMAGRQADPKLSGSDRHRQDVAGHDRGAVGFTDGRQASRRPRVVAFIHLLRRGGACAGPLLKWRLLTVTVKTYVCRVQKLGYHHISPVFYYVKYIHWVGTAQQVKNTCLQNASFSANELYKWFGTAWHSKASCNWDSMCEIIFRYSSLPALADDWREDNVFFLFISSKKPSLYKFIVYTSVLHVYNTSPKLYPKSDPVL